MILLVEDNVRIASFLADILRDDGREVRVAHSTGEAAALLASPGPIELLACDLALPGGSGWEVARLARRIHPEAEVLLMSGTPVASAGTHFILKPFDAPDFLAKVDALLDRGRDNTATGGC